jgi:hypothetical protein
MERITHQNDELNLRRCSPRIEKVAAHRLRKGAQPRKYSDVIIGSENIMKQ